MRRCFGCFNEDCSVRYNYFHIFVCCCCVFSLPGQLHYVSVEPILCPTSRRKSAEKLLAMPLKNYTIYFYIFIKNIMWYLWWWKINIHACWRKSALWEKRRNGRDDDEAAVRVLVERRRKRKGQFFSLKSPVSSECVFLPAFRTLHLFRACIQHPSIHQAI